MAQQQLPIYLAHVGRGKLAWYPFFIAFLGRVLLSSQKHKFSLQRCLIQRDFCQGTLDKASCIAALGVRVTKLTSEQQSFFLPYLFVILLGGECAASAKCELHKAQMFNMFQT